MSKKPQFIDPERFPAELRTLHHWVLWRNEKRNGKPTKVPYNPRTLRPASSIDRQTWGSYEQTLETGNGEGQNWNGLGFVFTDSDPYCGIDLDWKSWQGEGIPLEAQTIIDRLDSYAEVSPSAKGCHIIIRGTLPPGGNRCKLADGIDLEVYDSGRYFTVTGNHLEGTPQTVEDRQTQLEQLHAELFPPKAQTSPVQAPRPVSISDAELLKRMFKATNGAKVKQLWEGDWQGAGFTSQSEADLSLCSSLYFWTQGDLNRADSLFKQSGLMRPKWDERHYSDGKTYGQATLERCIGGEVYTPKGGKAKGQKPKGETKEGEAEVQTPALPEGYSIQDGAIYWQSPDSNKTAQKLCNFTAAVVSQITRDDGAELQTMLEIEGKLEGGQPLPKIVIAAEQFAGLGWVVKSWGVRAIVTAGQATKDRLREAIQTLSISAAYRTVYTHTGWRRLGESWVYLNAGQVIGLGEESEAVGVALPANLKLYQLPEPPQPQDLQTAVLASLAFLELAPTHITAPLWLCVLRAVVADSVDFGLFLVGETGIFKSEVAALVQQHFGAGLDARHLPASWESTGNALELVAFHAKNAVLVVDDFAPKGTQREADTLHGQASRLLRAAGNNQGRGRLRADGTARPEKPPRALLLNTGEDLPRGHSIRARNLVLDLERGMVDPTKLSQCQTDAANGLYAAALAGFIHWLAPRLEETQQRFKARVTELRPQIQAAHRRTPDAIAQLWASWEVWQRFSLEAGLLTQAELEAYSQTLWAGLTQTAQAQASHQAAADPVARVLELLPALFTSGRAHLSNTDGGKPNEEERWGWRVEFETSGGFSPSSKAVAKGAHIGWVSDTEAGRIYLEPESAYAALQQFAQAQGEPLTMSRRTLWTRMRERGYLIHDEARSDTKRRIGGLQKRVINLAVPLLGKTGDSGDGAKNADQDDL